MAFSRIAAARQLFTWVMTRARNSPLPLPPKSCSCRSSPVVPTSFTSSFREFTTRTLNSPLAPNSTCIPVMGSNKRTLESVPHLMPIWVARFTK